MTRAWTKYGFVYLYPADGGWDYRVIVAGQQICAGWVRGAKLEARVAAAEQAREKGLTIDG